MKIKPRKGSSADKHPSLEGKELNIKSVTASYEAWMRS